MATSKIYRPGYVNDFTSSLINDINKAPDSQYANLQYSSLNSDQQAALNQMMNHPEFNSYVDQFMNAGQTGLSELDNAYGKISNLYSSGNITAADIDRLSSQLYNRGDVEAGINAANQASERRFSTETNPAVAMQSLSGGYAGGSGGWGSSNRLMRNRAEEALVEEEQGNAEQITNNAYQNAQNQATGILTSNRQLNRSALGALASNASNLAQGMTQAGTLSQQSMQDAVNASHQSLQDRQNQMNIDYQNSIGRQNQSLQNIQNRLNSASLINGVIPPTTTQKTSGGGGGILGGMVSGAVTGFMTGGPYGALAGAAIGGASAAASQ